MAEDESKTADGRRRWQQWREEDARVVLEEHAKSGQSLTRFGRDRGVSLRRLMYWRKRLNESGSSPNFVAVAISPPPSARASTALIEIVAGRVAVRVREDLDVEHLARIVAAVGRRPPPGC